MNISHRSKLSLSQFLGQLPREEVRTLLMKHGLDTYALEWEMPASGLAAPVRDSVLNASEAGVASLLDELLRTGQTVRSAISPRYRYDERWADLVGCLEVDGYVEPKDEFGNGPKSFVPVDPTIEGQEPLEDDLTREIKEAQLPSVDGILRCLENSTLAFRDARNPDFNASLNNARVAMETIARDIAGSKVGSDEYNPGKWGSVLAALKTKALLTDDQEKGLAGVYRFLSPGSHRPQDMTEREYVRLSRHLAVSMAFFLLKLR